MNSRIKKIKKEAVPVLRRYGVVKAGVFGSFVTGKINKDSDIDILIKFKGRQSLLDIVRMERELKDNLRRKIDLVEYCIIHPRVKQRVLMEEVRIL